MSRDSAVPNDHYLSVKLRKNHVTMVKFISSTDEDYRRVVWHLRRIILGHSGDFFSAVTPSDCVSITVHSEAIGPVDVGPWPSPTAAQRGSEARRILQLGLALAQTRKSISTAFFFLLDRGDRGDSGPRSRIVPAEA